jgi:hypothetical protein
MFISAPIIRTIISSGFVFANAYIVINFGINPVRGGNPPNDRRRNGRRICMVVDCIISLFKFILIITDLMWNIINNGIIINEYMKKYSNDINGL